MTYQARLTRLRKLIDPITSAEASPSAFVPPGHKESERDRWSAAHDQALLDGRHKDVRPITLSSEDFRTLRIIGEGQFATVQLVQCALDQQLYAMKAIPKYKADRYSQALQLPAERHLHLLASEIDYSPAPALFAAFQSSSTLYLVMDLAASGSLADRIENLPGSLPEGEVRWWAAQLLEAITWVHKQGYVHRDIKPANLLVTSGHRLLISDFGSAAPCALDASLLDPQYCREPTGTPDYIAPEILRCAELALIEDDVPLTRYGRGVDWWSMGATIFELAVGQPPFYSSAIRSTYDAILVATRLIPASLSFALDDLLERLLCQSALRIDAEDIHRHAFFAVPTVHPPDLTGLCDIADGTSYLEPDSVSEMTDECVSITQIQPVGERNARWYGWTHLPSAVNPSEAPLKVSPARTVPQTPRPRRDREDATIMTSRREGLLNCVQQSARKQRRNAHSKSQGLKEELQSMTRSLDELSCRLQEIRRVLS
ncbi:kinase-like domain-containing protein [Dioszegia hungarica]|uniref:non-specific serine/threonine protein kinase n=1 Tax=Dioszegia hungarica TaxID=4972 RepID=A0AA38HE74_9TREE|nr:kinase-like domain-containing protein [Dioszegia hungarica]KAI9638950.1 kinase-like domain-containing protein [Dioszegia hungarica]